MYPIRPVPAALFALAALSVPACGGAPTADTPCAAYAVTGQDLPSPIQLAVRQHAVDKVKLLKGRSVVVLEDVFWVTRQQAFADCVFVNKLKTFSSATDAQRWWNRIGTGSVLRGLDGRLDELFLNGESLSQDLLPYFQSPRLHPEILYELSALMEYFDAVVSTQNASHDPDRGVAFPAQLKLLRIYAKQGKVPPEAVARVEETYTTASLNGKHRAPNTDHVVTSVLPLTPDQR